MYRFCWMIALVAGLSIALPCVAAAADAAPEAPDAAKAATSVSANVPDDATLIGVNLSSAEFGHTPGVFGRDYVYPNAEELDYCKAKNLTIVRVPVKWERLQPKLMHALNDTELKRLDHVINLAELRGVRVLIDLHNYDRYNGQLVGTDAVPNEAFANFWRRMAEHYEHSNGVFAFGLMNEPHATRGLWPASAQAAVDAIRSVDTTHTITVCGDAYAGAHSWIKANPNLDLHDPANRLLYEAHQYFDGDNSGRYGRSYDDDRATPDIGVKRLQPFVDWLKAHHARGFIGEFGVPDDDARWLVVLDNFLAAMREHHLGGTYWAAGPWWGSNPLSIEPRQGEDRPQMQVLSWYAGHRTKPADAHLDTAAMPPLNPPAHPAKRESGVYEIGKHRESYHYKNDASSYFSRTIADAGRTVRRITYHLQGRTAYVGVGLYFGSLDCHDRNALQLDARAAEPIKLTIKAHTRGKTYTAVCELTKDWQSFVIPFAKLTAGGEAYDGTKPLEKVELQPDGRPAANDLYLGRFATIKK